MLIILVLVVLLCLGGGFWGQGTYGLAGWSPLVIVLVIAVILLLSGRLR
jgi:hypothetical protein